MSSQTSSAPPLSRWRRCIGSCNSWGPCTNQTFGRDNVTHCIYSNFTWTIRSVLNMFII